MNTKLNHELEQLLATAKPADLGPGPRGGVMDEASIREAFGQLALPARPATDALLALVLLWHDHHESAHALSQSIETADGSYVHALVHRREPDYGNSKYWFRRVGLHPAYAELGRRVAALLEARGARAMADALVPGGRWDPLAFVDACETAATAAGQPRKSTGRSTEEQAALLREIQRLEFEILAAWLCGINAG